MRKIFKNIAMICLAICVSIGSFFVPVTKKRFNNYASANTSSLSYRFDGSNIYMPIVRPNTNIVDYTIYRNSFYISNDTGLFTVDLTDSLLFFNRNNGSNPNFRLVNFFASVQSRINYFTLSMSQIFDFPYQYRGFGNTLDNVDYIYNFYFYINSLDFNCNIKYLTLDCKPLSFTPHRLDTELSSVSSYFNIITYYDDNDNYFQILTPLPDVLLDDAGFNFRTYYITQNLTDNQIFQQGYNQGLSDNQQNVYENGYNTGYDIGFDRGKIRGGQEANNYSFLGLIGAVVDAPVSILSSLFNFTFLGINLWSFITSLLTIALILFVVKKFMGR